MVQRLHFFFSSRRRHTRWPRDWSSDVCSSDLILLHQGSGGIGGAAADIELQGDDLREVRDSVLTRIAEATGQTYEQVFADSLRDKWFAADAARDYGLIDDILTAPAQLHAKIGGTR